jgi:hypothetical protein
VAKLCSVSNDIEIWLLFAPFWILGMAALIGGIWHMVHGWRHARIGSDRSHHHFRRAKIGLAAFVALLLIGLGVGAAVGLVAGG